MEAMEELIKGLIKEELEKVEKEKRPLDRHTGGWFGTAVTEQVYVDNNFESIREKMESINENLKERVDILEYLVTIKHMLICTQEGWISNEKDADGDTVWLGAAEAREKAKKDGYEYINSFKKNGELWVKKGR